MFLIGLGALLVIGGILYMARAAIWRGPLSGPDSSRPVRDALEPPRRGVRFLGLGTNWPDIEDRTPGNLGRTVVAGRNRIPGEVGRRQSPPSLF
jgi:hypothetical protein